MLAGAGALALLPAAAAVAGTADTPAPGSPAFVARDTRNVADAYGRQTAPDGQLTPDYLLALQRVSTTTEAAQLLQQATRPNHPAISPGNLAPGWNVGNPYRDKWNGTRGRIAPVRFANRYGADLVGDVFAPLPGARDPYTGRAVTGPFPAVVITPGSVQGSERMYWWLAEDLAERGYVVLTFDTQGQGRSETLPHQDPPPLAPNVPGAKITPNVPFCDPLLPPAQYESNGCPGVPSQQASNFVVGTEDAISFLLSTPAKRYRGTSNPYWQQIDRRPDATPTAPGRTAKVAVIGHSLGAFAVSYLQGVDPRIATTVALDKLSSGAGTNPPGVSLPLTTPVVPALGVQSEYGFTVAPYTLNGGSSLAPQPLPPNQAPDRRRELATGYDAWRARAVDSMVVVPRASTHLEYTDLPLGLPASRYGQDLASHYVQAWLGKYLKDDPSADTSLLATRFRYLEPTSSGAWKPVTLDRNPHLSYQFCSAYSWTRTGGGRVSSKDVNGVGC
ncbi:MAG TPA: hypothetical protein VLR26_12320 [Frankiaceae bacterium]|nr:hypothetical protein [Frankiaceae bacterium]